MTIFDERIEKLRKEMEAEKIDFYLIPTADDHSSEYISDFYKVRNYYAGFTGSAGTLLIGMDMAGLWTDGRYFIQAENQLAGSQVELFRMGNAGVPTVSDYLKEHVPEGGTLAFDGQVVDFAQGEGYEEMLASKHGRLLWNRDLAGSLWEERPERSAEPVYILDEKYAGKSRGEKLSELRRYMEKKGGDRVLLSSLEDIAWLMNLRGSDVSHTPVFLAFALIEQDTVQLYADGRAFSEAVTETLAGDRIILKPYMEIYEDLKKLSEGKLMYDSEKVNYALCQCVPKTVSVLPADIHEMIPKAVKN